MFLPRKKYQCTNNISCGWRGPAECLTHGSHVPHPGLQSWRHTHRTRAAECSLDVRCEARAGLVSAATDRKTSDAAEGMSQGLCSLQNALHFRDIRRHSVLFTIFHWAYYYSHPSTPHSVAVVLSLSGEESTDVHPMLGGFYMGPPFVSCCVYLYN